jgi:hypothetical protein
MLNELSEWITESPILASSQRSPRVAMEGRAMIGMFLPHLAALLTTRLSRSAAFSANLAETFWPGGLT